MKNGLCKAIYILCITAFSVFSFKKQEYNWDMLPYMAVILSYDTHDFDLVHKIVYQTIRQKTPASDYQLLTDGGVEMRRLSTADPEYFRMQMPFYTVKPFYTRIAYCLYKAGVPLEKSVVLPSVISYFFIAMFVFYWLGNYVPLFWRFPLCLLLMLCGFLLSVGRISSPDCLSSLLLLVAFYNLIEKKSINIILVFLMLSILTRLDNMIVALAIVLMLTYTGKWKEKLPAGKAMLIIFVMCACYFGASYNAKEFGWSIFYYPSFIDRLNTTHSSNSSFSIYDYFSVARSQVISGLVYSHICLFILLGFIVLITNRTSSLKSFDFDQLLTVVFFIILFARFVFHPAVADRFYTGYYICILVLLIKKFCLIPLKQIELGNTI